MCQIGVVNIQNKILPNSLGSHILSSMVSHDENIGKGNFKKKKNY